MGKMKVGDWLEVRSKEEILSTLDSKGQLDGMPFMPEMFAFCGKRFPVYKRAHKTCDTVFPVRGRRVEDAVHLETRCDGQAHGGCQAGCLLFWKEEWLKPISAGTVEPVLPKSDTPGEAWSIPLVSAEARVWDCTKVADEQGAPPRYACQATQLPYATKDLEWWEIGQYVEDYLSGNVGLWRIVCGLLYSSYYNLSEAGIGVGRLMRWLYEQVDIRLRGRRFPRRRGTIPRGEKTPDVSLDLQPGELVRVKSHAEILKTLNVASRNRGMTWDAEMVPYCGGTYRVLRRVTRIINENTGRMQEMKNPCIILDTVVCEGRYSHCRMFCPRSIYPYWREIWLERVQSNTSDTGESNDSQPQRVLTTRS